MSVYGSRTYLYVCLGSRTCLYGCLWFKDMPLCLHGFKNLPLCLSGGTSLVVVSTGHGMECECEECVEWAEEELELSAVGARGSLNNDARSSPNPNPATYKEKFILYTLNMMRY